MHRAKGTTDLSFPLFAIKSRPATGHLPAVLVADWFNLAIRCSGSHISLNAESLKPCAEGSFQPKSFTNIWVWVFFLWHQCYCALLLWVPLLQEIGGISRLRFREKQTGDIRLWSCAKCVSSQQFRNHREVANGCLMEVFRLQEKAGKR